MDSKLLIAFLRGINVGGHKVIRMSELAAMFSGLGFGDVRTFIASGNVLFDNGGTTHDRELLQDHIELAILSRFGYDVTAMVRTCEEIAALAGSFGAPDPPDKAYALFLSGKPSPEGMASLKSLEDEVNRFEFREMDVIWSCLRSKGDSRLTNVSLEKKLGVAATMRDWNTVVKLVGLCQVD